MTELFKRCLYAKYTHSGKGGDYAIQVEDDTLYLLFECSDGLEDWRSNFNFFATVCKSISSAKIPYKNMEIRWRVHGGFLRVWKSIQDEVEAKISETIEANPSVAYITVVGYSHGAALAVLATEDMVYLYGDNYEVKGYGFGTPRVLWGRVPQEIKVRLSCFTSIRNIPDLVTRVPPKWLFYKDAGVVLDVGEKGKYNCIKAHYSSAYITELEEYEQAQERLLDDLEDRA